MGSMVAVLLAWGAADALVAEAFGADLAAGFFEAVLAEGVVFFEVTEARGFRFSPFEEVVSMFLAGSEPDTAWVSNGLK